MPNFIHTADNGILRLFSTIWIIGTYPYRAIRGLLFILIYPASTIFNPQSCKYNKARSSFIENTVNLGLAHIVNFDLQANMQPGEITATQKKNSRHRYFDAAIFTKDFSNIYNPNNQFIIMAGGNATCYEENAKQMRAMINAYINVIGFNPMGVGMSPGVTNGPDDYQAAIKSIINNLSQHGIPHDHIVLQGHSLGAAMCLLVAEQYQARGERVKVIADRTFARLDNTAGTMLGVLYSPVKILVKLFSLNIDAATAFNNINQNNPGDAIGLSVDNDGIIPDSCSLYNGVNDTMRQKSFVKKFSAYGADYHDIPAHNIPSEYIQENEYTNNRKTGAQFTAQYRKTFKLQMTYASTIQSSMVNDEATADILKPRPPAITHLKDAQEARAKASSFHPTSTVLQAQFFARKSASNTLSNLLS